MENLTMDKLVAHCKNTGIVYPGSDIYDGLANTWITVQLVQNSKTTSKKLGGKDLFKNLKTAMVLTQQL